MTTKTKVLKILDKHRDVSLTMGCEVVVRHNNDSFQKVTLIKKKKIAENCHSYRYRGNKFHYVWFLKECGYKPLESDVVEILGHPATPLTLLKALGEVEKDGDCWWFIDQWGNIEEHNTGDRIATIPNVTTLSEIPEEHKMWQAVLDVLI